LPAAREREREREREERREGQQRGRRRVEKERYTLHPPTPPVTMYTR